MIVYLDTSAALKLVIEEEESQALVDELGALGTADLVSSWLLHAEMHCAAGRHPGQIDPEDVGAVLKTVGLVDVTRGDLLTAGTHAPLRSGDAIHLSAALRVGSEVMLTYDQELAKSARRAGLLVLSPT